MGLLLRLCIVTIPCCPLGAATDKLAYAADGSSIVVGCPEDVVDPSEVDEAVEDIGVEIAGIVIFAMECF